MLNGHLFWQFRRFRRIAGWGGVMAIGLVPVVALFQLKVVLPLRDNMTELRAEAEHLRSRVVTRQAVAESQDPGAQLREFYRFFPEGSATTNGDAMTDVLARIYEAATQEGVLLEHGEYQLSPIKEGRLSRYDVTLPISGPYPKLRRFIAKVLRDNPSLALDGVSFGRQAAADIGVSAQVRMTLYMRAESA
jgi:hypothetical protein